ncbi:MAG: SH3 domain-containing protein [Thermomicrobiales bacterium]
MTDSGLSTRLRQQHRRAGLMVGITMVIAVVICVFGAAVLFAALSRPFSDLIPLAVTNNPLQTTQPTPNAPSEDNGANAAIVPEPTAAPVIEAASDDAADAPITPTTTAEDFEPTHQIGAAQSVNFRSGPSTSDAIIVALSPSTPLEYLDEDAPTDNPSDGDRWMRFRTEDGEEGWVREIDTTTYQP